MAKFRLPVRLFAALCLALAAWVFLLAQNERLWQRLPDSTAERYVADAVSARLDPAVPPLAMRSLCRAAPSWVDGWWRPHALASLARCLADPRQLVDAEAAQAERARFDALLLQQMQQAQSWLAAYPAAAAAARENLQQQLRDARAAANASMLAAVAGRVPVREAVDPPFSADGAAFEALRARLVSTASARLAILQSGAPAAEQARELALLATGKRIAWDYGKAPPEPSIATAQHTLADQLEWLRRGQQNGAEGARLQDLHALPGAIALAALLLVLVAAGARLPLLPCLGAGWLLGAGALLLVDVSLTGAPALRHFAQRQFLLLDALQLELVAPLPALAGGLVCGIWLPLAAAALLMLLVAWCVQNKGRWLAPLRAWVNLGGGKWGALAQVLLLTGAAGAVLLPFGTAAVKSELLLFLACAGIAGYLALAAPAANSGGGLQALGLAVVGAALAAALGASVLRGDLGHALVALLLAAIYLWLFGNRWARAAVLAGAAGALGTLVGCLQAGRLVGPLAWLEARLPEHAQERLLAMVDPFSAAVSDLARVRWLMASAGSAGWQPGLVPWQGIQTGGAQLGLPLQGPSDYVFALLCAEWGLAGALAWFALAFAVFGGAAWFALRAALRPGVAAALRWLAALGGLGCCVMLAKLALSFGGVSGLLPLTGLPVALLGYGPSGNFAALLYLALALGASGAAGPAPAALVRLLPAAAAPGLVRRRNLALAALAVPLCAAGVAGAYVRLSDAPAHDAQRHVPAARFQLAQAVAGALQPPPLPAAPDLPCPQLDNAVQAWNTRLAELGARRLDAGRLIAALPQQAADCARLARALGGLLPRAAALAGAAGGSPASAAQRLAAAAAQPPRPRAQLRDFATRNAYWGYQGCLQTSIGGDACDAAGEALEQLAGDPWLQRELPVRIATALHTPVAQKRINGRELPSGPQLQLTLDARLQALAQNVVDCHSGRARGPACAAVAPLDPAARQRFEAAGGLRAGAMGMVVMDVDSGRILALANAMSDCSLAALAHKTVDDPKQPRRALADGQPCARFPDRTSAWLAGMAPALWPVPPGSSLKLLDLAAAVDAGLVSTAEDSQWKGVLAKSQDNASIQRITLAAGQRYLDLLASSGFADGHMDLLWGGGAAQATAWTARSYQGYELLRAGRMEYASMERMRQEKEAGVNIDQRYGHAQVSAYLDARRLADAATGGADLRISALGLAELWRRLALRAGGAGAAPAGHLLEQAGRPAPAVALPKVAPASAARAIAMTSGITSSAWSGTAQGSCRVVFGACKAEGLDGLWGKTGTSDFLLKEQSSLAKPGLQIPAKLFGGVFTAGSRRYAIGVMALRVRDGRSATLEFHASAPAEAALTLLRELRRAGDSEN